MAIGLIDANNFYASTEKVCDPELTARPVIVLSNNDGCVVARSREAREVGIPMAVPLFEVRPLVERHNVSVLSSNYELYADFSRRFQSLLYDFTPDVEHYSIDEAFVKMPLSSGSLASVGQEMRDRIEALTGIPVSVGFAPTKTLAKIAVEIAKTSNKARGGVSLTEARYQQAALERVKVGDVWGVGPRYAAMLESHGIRTALDLREADDHWVRRRMTVVGLRTVHELRGRPCIAFEPTPKTKQEISVSRSFGAATGNLREIRAAVAFFASWAAEKLRHHGLLAGTITVFVTTDRFKDAPQYSASKTLDIAPKSDSTLELLPLALHALSKVYRPDFQIRKAGVLLGELELAERVSRRLWENERYEVQRRLMAAMDGLNERWGREAVRCGLFPNAGTWRTRFGQRSPCYTTDWGQVMRAH